MTEQINQTAQTTQEARSAPIAGEAPHTTSGAPIAGLAPNQTQEMPAREPWKPPTVLELAKSLTELTEDKTRHPGLLSLLNGPHRDMGKVGKFLSEDDWRNIIWAVQAWTILMNLPDEVEQKGGSKLATLLRKIRGSIVKRAARIWNP